MSWSLFRCRSVRCFFGLFFQINFSLAFDKAPGPIKAMDRKRFEMMEADEAQESPAQLPNDEKIALTSEN